jgi:hypothetical protein
MASSLWQLEVGSVRLPLREWGIRNPVLTCLNRGVDSLAFHVPAADVFVAAPFAVGAAATLWRGDVRWFSGEFEDPAAAGSGEGEGHAFNIVGPWRALEEITYEQPYAIKDETFTGLVGSMSTRVVFGQNAWGVKVTIDEQVRSIGRYALTQGGGFFTIAELDALHEPPLSEARDISCAAAIQRMLDLVPDSAVWFDYSTATPGMYLKRRSALAAVSLDASSGLVIRGLSSLRKRTELQARGVVFIFQTTEENEADAREYTRESRQTAGATSGRRIVRATLQLARDEAEPAGLAAAYYAAVGEAHYSGQITLKERECSGLVRVGNTLNLTNGKAEWATMNAVVQQVVENLDTGETEITVGPCEVLGPADFADLMRYWRERPPLSDFHEKQHNGTEGVDDSAGEPGIDGFGGGDPDTDPGSRTGNTKAGRPAGGSGSGMGGAIGGATETLTKCVEGVEQQVTVIRGT